jgi:hypothetical protein
MTTTKRSPKDATGVTLISARTAELALVLALGMASTSAAQVYTRRNPNGVVEATNIPDEADFRLTYPGKGTLIHSKGYQWTSMLTSMYDNHVEAAARVYQVNPDLVRAVMGVESEYDQWAVSSKGARGLMQLMPATARRLGVLDSFDARQNIFGGAQYLRILLDQFQGDLTLVLAAYNAGENAVLRYRGVPPYKETRGYVQKVQARMGGTQASEPAAGAAAAFYTPGSTAASLRPTPGARARSAGRPKVEPARPRMYYRWRDDRGVTHVAEAPPPEGTVYATVRALD